MACQGVLDRPCWGGAFHSLGREPKKLLSAAVKPGDDGVALQEQEYQESLQAAQATIGRFLKGIRGGRFDVLPSGDCPSYCAYRQICHYSLARAEVKSPEVQT